MSGNQRVQGIVEEWKLTLQGRPVQVAQRLFVLGLAAVTLSVWAVTVMGVGILRSPGGMGPRSAMAAVPTSDVVAIDIGGLVERVQEPVDGPAKKISVAVAMPRRDPFEASVLHFGQVVTAASGQADDSRSAGIALEAAKVQRQAGLGQVTSQEGGGESGRPGRVELSGGVLSAPLTLDGVMAGSGQNVAMINGVVFRVGDTIKVRVGEQILEVAVESISARSVELGAGDDRIKLEMKR